MDRDTKAMVTTISLVVLTSSIFLLFSISPINPFIIFHELMHYIACKLLGCNCIFETSGVAGVTKVVGNLSPLEIIFISSFPYVVELVILSALMTKAELSPVAGTLWLCSDLFRPFLSGIPQDFSYFNIPSFFSILPIIIGLAVFFFSFKTGFEHYRRIS